MAEGKGTWRVADGEQVDAAEAQAAWTEAARPKLLTVAGRYGDFITYKDLALYVQDETGIRTTQRVDNWMSIVLATIARDCTKRNEPLLSAFAVRTDQTVGENYAITVRENLGTDPADPDRHAAEERYKAYQHFGAVLPSDGGRPRLPPTIARRRERAAKDVPRPRRAQCPNCFVEVAADGRCGMCGDEL